MSVKLKIRKGDKVVVTTGKDKGKKGEVLKVLPSENRAVVQGVNIVRRHPPGTGWDHRQGSADQHFEYRDRGPEDRGSDACGFQDA
jgi:ribosomal protein L24